MVRWISHRVFISFSIHWLIFKIKRKYHYIALNVCIVVNQVTAYAIHVQIFVDMIMFVFTFQINIRS